MMIELLRLCLRRWKGRERQQLVAHAQTEELSLAAIDAKRQQLLHAGQVREKLEELGHEALAAPKCPGPHWIAMYKGKRLRASHSLPERGERNHL